MEAIQSDTKVPFILYIKFKFRLFDLRLLELEIEHFKFLHKVQKLSRQDNILPLAFLQSLSNSEEPENNEDITFKIKIQFVSASIEIEI